LYLEGWGERSKRKKTGFIVETQPGGNRIKPLSGAAHDKKKCRSRKKERGCCHFGSRHRRSRGHGREALEKACGNAVAERPRGSETEDPERCAVGSDSAKRAKGGQEKTLKIRTCSTKTNEKDCLKRI